MIRFLRQHAVLVILITGMSIRLVTIAMPGTEAMTDIQRWGAQALFGGFTNVYGLRDTRLAEALVWAWHSENPREAFRKVGEDVQRVIMRGPAYGPVSAFLFWWSASWAYSLKGSFVRGGPLMNACFNLSSILAVLLTALAASSFLAREKFPARALAVGCFCLSPALLLHSALGYVDSVFTMFGFFSLVFLYRRRYRPAVWCAALSCLTRSEERRVGKECRL